MSARAEGISPPQEIFKYATSATCVHLLLPTKFHADYVTVKAVTTGIWVKFTKGTKGTAPADLVIATNGTGGGASTEMAADPASGYYIGPGEEKDFDIAEIVRLRTSSANAGTPGDARVFLSHIAADANGFVIIYKSSGPKGA